MVTKLVGVQFREYAIGTPPWSYKNLTGTHARGEYHDRAAVDSTYTKPPI